MKNRCNSISRKRLLALLLSALLLLGMLPAVGAFAAEDKGSLTVKLNETTRARLTSVPEVTLYQIGDADPSSKAGWTMRSEFARFGVLEAQKPEELAAIGERIVAFLKGNTAIQGTTKDMKDGKALFSDLSYGIYLGYVTGVPENLEVTPFIVTLPSRDPGDETRLRTNYDVVVKDEWVTSATVKKVWDDANDQDGLRPDHIDVFLSDPGKTKVTLSDANNWTKTVDGLAMYANGKEIEYTWTEAKVNGYISTSVTNGQITELTNKHTTEKTQVKVLKVWNDKNNQDGIRPESVEVQLMNGATPVGNPVTLSENNHWTYTWQNLEKNAKGQPIAYTVVEPNVPNGYTMKVSEDLDGTAVFYYEIENAHTPDTVSVKVLKTWSDDDDRDGIRPTSVKVQLKADGEKAGEVVTLDKNNNWTHTWSNLDKSANGKAIAYEVDEVDVPVGYKKTVSTDQDGTINYSYIIDNAHSPTETEATIKKVWQDDNNSQGKRPKSISVSLMAGTQVIRNVTLDDTNGWTHTIYHLNKYDQGKEIKYTWSEAKVDGYTSTQVTDGTITTLTNVLPTPSETPTTTETPTPPPTDTPPGPTPTPTTSLSIQKVWQDENNAHKTRPASITVALLANGVQTMEKTIHGNATSETWTFTFVNLPAVDASGATINYTISETQVPGYETPVVEGNTITNKLIPKTPEEYTNLGGQKTWVDGENANGQRPNHIEVYLQRDGVDVEHRTVTAANGWKYDFGQQPVDDGYGNKYTYTVREDGVPGYFVRTEGLNLINTELSRTPPPPTGTTTNRTYTPTGTITNRRTASSVPPFASMNEEQIDEFVDIIDYDTPLWGQLLGTGDETPIYPYVFAGVGALALIALVVFGFKRKKKVK